MSFDKLPADVARIEQRLMAIEKRLVHPDDPEWWSLKAAACRKFGHGDPQITIKLGKDGKPEIKVKRGEKGYNSLRVRPQKYWPNFGRIHRVQSSGTFSRAYHRDEVYAWLQLDDEAIDRLFDLLIKRNIHGNNHLYEKLFELEAAA